MFLEKFKPIIKGYIKGIIPNANRLQTTGGTNESEYCYSTWLRHLIKINSKVKGVPESVLELGPGDTLGIGIAALLSGVNSYVGLDIHKYWNSEANVEIFDELVGLFQSRAPLDAENKYPRLTPYLDNYNFPEEILSKEYMAVALAPQRLNAVRNELNNPNSTNKHVRFYSPWQTNDVPPESVEFVYSQSVLQYTDLPYVYSSVHHWLKKGGLTAHSIDFSSLGITKTWNGHWCFSDFEWKQYCFRKTMLLNRSFFSEHKSFLEDLNFKIIDVVKYKSENTLQTTQLGQRAKNIHADDLSTSAAYMLSLKL